MRAIIIDDENKARAVLKKMLTLVNDEIEIVGEANSVENGVKLLRDTEVDILFLDVRMEDGTGFDLLNCLKEFNAHLIFTTAYDKYAVQAFKYEAIDYLLKPINIEDLQETLMRIGKMEAKKPNFDFFESMASDMNGATINKLAFPTAKEMEFHSPEEIMYIEGEGSYSYVHLKNGQKIITTKILKEIESLLNPEYFFRIHKSFTVNLREVSKFYKEGYIEMIDGKKLEISRRKKSDFVNRFMKI